MDLKFSVAMCVYAGDRPEWFGAAVESILNQTRRPDEIVLVVDGPVPDELNTVITGYESNEVFRVIRLKQNKGHGEARRIGLKCCTHELVALMDADDISASDRFERQLALFRTNPGLAVVGGQITEFLEHPDNLIGARSVLLTDAAIKEDLKTRCPMNQVTVMFRKSVIESVGGYIDWFCEEDYYLWIRLYLAEAEFANVSEYLVNVRVGEQMYQRRGGLKYFFSEAKLQKYMLDKKIISVATCCVNICIRFVVQILLPNRLRSWVFRKFARKAIKHE